MGKTVSQPSQTDFLCSGFQVGQMNKMKLFEEISEHGIFHGITVWKENKPLNIKGKKGLFTIEWE
jgi:hypothetical protein